MRIVVQRVSRAEVFIGGVEVAKIASGLCVFLGIRLGDTDKDVAYLVKKVAKLRVFSDDQGKMSKSVLDVQGDIVVVSQFTLYGTCYNGCRPDFTEAAPPSEAFALYEIFLLDLEKEIGRSVQCGQFREMMDVSLVNDGPVTLIIDSRVY